MAHHPLWTLTYTSPDTGKLESGNQQRVNALAQMDLAVNSRKSKKPYSQVCAFTSSASTTSAVSPESSRAPSSDKPASNCN
ncbi:hypothetical protein G3I36_21250 [Streptomyces sp. SID10362]|uniref:hypothetical protein n=1 Tax=Streptomyces sp. SID10362 TaxID=2706021 RepID=UPI0013C9675E|nr:hypothetical protein [Streptomyces sp. SID10362]NDZ73533.1 hypothetical protein [Streptomyces sp. SID10362]